jgi:hemerythrin-like domain-containing protein
MSAPPAPTLTCLRRRPQRYARRVKRHAALIPLSHDHHDALVAARRLRRAADGTERAAAAAAFLAFFAADTVGHFRQEEELLFPQVVDRAETQALVVEALLQHQRLHALAAQLTADLAAGSTDPVVMRDLGQLLEAHVRLEERQLFPLIEELLGEKLAGLDLTVREADRQGNGPVWGTASEQLNATVLEWRAGEGPSAHVNEERDVLVVVIAGSVILGTDEGAQELTAGEATIIPKGQRRQLTAGTRGTRYLSAHRRRPPLQIQPVKAQSAESER